MKLIKNTFFNLQGQILFYFRDTYQHEDIITRKWECNNVDEYTMRFLQLFSLS